MTPHGADNDWLAECRWRTGQLIDAATTAGAEVFVVDAGRYDDGAQGRAAHPPRPPGVSPPSR